MPVWARSRANTFSSALRALSSIGDVAAAGCAARARDRRRCARAAPPPARRRPRGPRRSRCGACCRTSPTSGACTNAAPAFSLIARSPSVPSEPIPERITPMLRLLLVLGERAKEEIDGKVQAPRRRLRHEVQRAVQQRHVLAGRDDVDVIGLDRQADPWPAGPASSSPAAAARRASPCAWGRGAGRRRRPCRCSGGRRLRNCSSASSPPAEAPIPTTGNRAGSAAMDSRAASGAAAGRARRGALGAFADRRASFGRAPCPPVARVRAGRWIGHTRRLFRRASSSHFRAGASRAWSMHHPVVLTNSSIAACVGLLGPMFNTFEPCRGTTRGAARARSRLS